MQSQRPTQYGLRTRSRISALAAASSEETLGTAPTNAENGNNPRTLTSVVRPATSRTEQAAPVVQSSVSPNLSLAYNAGRRNSVDTDSPGAPKKPPIIDDWTPGHSPEAQRPSLGPSTPPEPPREQPLRNIINTTDEVLPDPVTPPGLLPSLPIRAPPPHPAGPPNDPVITAAEDRLSRQDRENLDRRYTRIRVTSDQQRARPHSTSPSRRAGPSNTQNKGKGIDPRNWGNLNFEPLEQDIEVQAQLLNSFNQHNNNQPSGDKGMTPDAVDSTLGGKSIYGHHQSSRRLAGRPVNQITPNS